MLNFLLCSLLRLFIFIEDKDLLFVYKCCAHVAGMSSETRKKVTGKCQQPFSHLSFPKLIGIDIEKTRKYINLSSVD